ncbi:MAG: hypothetical protein K0M45_04030, partial [Candidatus Paracaedibacteraceae bacterium]|nr:hypothetical protein [Candidatus Paracaedibacteraceae bacterium]
MTREKLSGLAQQLMIYCAYLDPDTIVEEIFLQGFQGYSPKYIQAAFEQLSAYSLIKRRENSTVFYMHRLLQLVIRNDQQQRKKQAIYLRGLEKIFSRASLSEDSPLPKIRNYGGNGVLDLYELLGKYRINLERVINHCKDLEIDKSILVPYQIDYMMINKCYTSSKDEIFKGKNKLPENSSEEAKAISLLKKELEEGGLSLEDKKCRVIFRSIPQNSQELDRLRIARVLSMMDLSECQSFMDVAKQLITPVMGGHDQAFIIIALAKVESDQRQSFAEAAKQLLTPGMGGDERSSIIITLTKVEPDQRQSFAEAAKQLLTLDMSGDDVVHMIDALVKVESDQRQSFAEVAKQLWVPDIRGYEQASIIVGLAEVKADQRQSVINSAKQLFAVSRGGYEQASIITALTKVKSDKQQRLIDSAKQLFTPGMRGDEQASIITALTKVESDQQQRLIDSAKQLFTPDMEGYEQASIIAALAQVEAAQRQSVIESAKQLFTPGIGRDERSS